MVLPKTNRANGNRKRIQQSSRWIIRILWFGLIAAPVMNTLFWACIPHSSSAWQEMVLPAYVQHPIPLQAQILGWLVSFIPLSLGMLAIWILIRLFRLYQNARIFTADNVRCFKQLSRTLIGWSLLGFVVDPLMSVALTAHHPVGARVLSIGIGGHDLSLLLVGVILAVISWVMDEGRKINTENELTI